MEQVKEPRQRIGKRTGIDWSKHKHQVSGGKLPSVTIEGKPDEITLRIDDLKIPGSYTNWVQFINTCGVMTVTGDFGNWVFCREFYPSKGGGASEGYWKEKLQISSCQKPSSYDSEGTTEEIQRRIAEKEYHNEAELVWLEELLHFADDEIQFLYHAYRQQPSHVDCENVPMEEKVNHWFLIIMDAFDEICQRMNEK